MNVSDRETRVLHHIAGMRDKLLDELRLHVGIPTGGRNVAALDESRERLTSRARALGATMHMVEGRERPAWLFGEQTGQTPLPTAICRRFAGRAGREVLLAGHLDTVHDPRGPFQTLTLSSDGKKGVGPGCVDMKGGLVIALAALEALEHVGESVPWTLLLNSDEETGSYHSFDAILEESKRVHAAQGVGIALEPATPEGGLVVSRAGSGQIVIEARGVSAHVGRDFASGVNAVVALSKAVIDISALSDPARGVIVNVGPLQGNTATNVVPDLARAWGNVRFSELLQAEQFAAKLKAMERAPAPGQAALTIHSSFARPAKPLVPATRALAELAQKAAGDLDQRLPFTSTAGVCDGNIMQHAGLATIDTLGVRGGGLHTLSEWIEIDSLVERCQLLALTILRASSNPAV